METIVSFLARSGADVCGVCGFDPALLSVACRARARVPAAARSVIVAAFPYYVGDFPHRNVSRYAMVDDYHAVAGAALAGLCEALRRAHPAERFEPFVDSSPFDEVSLGVRAGLGVRGQNGQLINGRYGSYIFIGEVVSTLALPPTGPGPAGEAASCAGCGRCIAACPGGALSKAGLCREKCLSHLTQKKRLDDPAGRAAVARGGLAWGCDVCTDVCPMNRRALYSPVGAFYRNIRAVVTNNNDHSGHWDSVFAPRAWDWRGYAVLRRNLALIEEDGGSSSGNHHARAVRGI